MEFEDAETCSALLTCLDSLLSEAHLMSREKGMGCPMHMLHVQKCVFDSAQMILPRTIHV